MSLVTEGNKQEAKVTWETFSRGKYTEYRMFAGRKSPVLQLIPTAYNGVKAWEARTLSGPYHQYRVDASTPEEAMAKVERKEWISVG